MQPTTDIAPVEPERLTRIKEAAFRIRTNALIQGEVQGQGYIARPWTSPTSWRCSTPTS